MREADDGVLATAITCSGPPPHLGGQVTATRVARVPGCVGARFSSPRERVARRSAGHGHVCAPDGGAVERDSEWVRWQL
ncbi:hypothetical protein SBD_4816 [Streptomyces bottropensis ATCC 25435]|uniref:Uncharacterized protein n=1 Tax=Streptomyces bottropensis ATCC 25435 TaxID=1054862 RepID=M3DAD6_9ACTN|nr:hypothetical protein SBD_4816 [Streptomyces bottropensis ATCC 25435]